jgi:predicted metal-binding membrane protein
MTGRVPGIRVDASLERLLRHDRWIVLAALGVVVVLAWALLLAGAGMGVSAAEMTRMSLPGADHSAMAPMRPATWDAGYALVMLAMWWIMMVAMMLPSATPMILLFAAIQRREQRCGGPYVPTSVFGLGYLACWAGFSLAAVLAQWGLARLALLSPMLMTTSTALAGTLLVAAGLYQLSPLKLACLVHCRSPAHFIVAHWRPGVLGALHMGLAHGAFCVGCCWFLMVLLFVGGVMNLYWIVAIAGLVLLEKTVPAGHWLAQATGVVLAVWGAWLLLSTT